MISLFASQPDARTRKEGKEEGNKLIVGAGNEKVITRWTNHPIDSGDCKSVSGETLKTIPFEIPNANRLILRGCGKMTAIGTPTERPYFCILLKSTETHILGSI